MRQLQEIMARAREQRVTPGGIVAFGDADRDELVPFGTLDYAEDSSPVTESTIYDVASLTKPMATVTLAMKMASLGRLDVDDPVASVIGEIPTDITFAHLLGHASGYPAHVEFFRRMSSERGDRDQLFELARAVHPQSAPGLQSVYSDVGFILLGAALERLTEQRLDELFTEHVASPMALRDTGFIDSAAGARHPELDRVAPTERCPWRGEVVRGRVHDENAFAGGGICGHAGLFSTGKDVALFARALLSSWAGEDRIGLDPEVVVAFLARHAAPESSWRLGWDTPAPTTGISHAGDVWPRTESAGHLAFTGCSLWLHRERSRYVAILSNRVHPSRDNAGIRELRRELMDTAARALGL